MCVISKKLWNIDQVPTSKYLYDKYIFELNANSKHGYLNVYFPHPLSINKNIFVSNKIILTH